VSRNASFARLFLIFALTLGCVAVPLSQVAHAADEEEAAGGESMSAIQFVKYGGLIGGVLILASVVGLGMSIERGIGLKRDNVVPPDVLAQLEQLFDEEEYEEAMTVCETQPCFLTNVIAAGLPKIGTGWENISNAMQEVGDFEATKMQQSISYINFIVNVSPLIGLFGTVTGMIGAFNTISTSPTPPTPAQLAGGIQQALVTTCMGLFVAIPFSLVYFYFRNKVQRMILEVAAIADELMERFKD
jgi:biopolymer transport protein ExbB